MPTHPTAYHVSKTRKTFALLLTFVAIVITAAAIWCALMAYEGFTIVADSAPGGLLDHPLNAALGRTMAILGSVFSVVFALLALAVYYIARRLAPNPVPTAIPAPEPMVEAAPAPASIA